jgi:hypothetical protein
LPGSSLEGFGGDSAAGKLGTCWIENNFLWTALAVWILVWRLGQIIVVGQLIVGYSLFIEELIESV